MPFLVVLSSFPGSQHCPMLSKVLMMGWRSKGNPTLRAEGQRFLGRLPQETKAARWICEALVFPSCLELEKHSITLPFPHVAGPQGLPFGDRSVERLCARNGTLIYDPCGVQRPSMVSTKKVKLSPNTEIPGHVPHQDVMFGRIKPYWDILGVSHSLVPMDDDGSVCRAFPSYNYYRSWDTT